MFGLKKKQTSKVEDKSKHGGTTARSNLGEISKMLNPSGRIAPQLLEKLAKVYQKVEFTKFLEQAVLVGSSIQSGSLNLRMRASKEAMNQTVIFEVNEEEAASSPSESLKHAIYPLVKSENATGSGSIFTVGRVDGNDMIMPDYAISKQHAILEIKRENYFIRDCGSTNGTTVNGKRLEKKLLQLQDGDVIGFARYEFSLLSPQSLYDMLSNT